MSEAALTSKTPNLVSTIVQTHMEVVTRFFDTHEDDIYKCARLCVDALNNGHKILLCGNGGSAADAQHIAAEFVGRFVKDRRALPAIALTTDTSILTAVGNDYGYDDVFSRQVEALGREGDVLFAISTSGNSRNVVNALNAAKANDMTTISLIGKDGGAMKGMNETDMVFHVDTPITAHIQECHIMLLHMVCALIEVEMGMDSHAEYA